MKFAYEDLSPAQFEELVILICQRLLGISTQGFATGADGGRDARFEGTAEMHPSTSAPWVGQVVIQAKHTNGYNKHFGESDFFDPTTESNTLALEVPRIKKLRAARELDHYMLFANRRLTAGVHQKIRKHILEKCGIPSSSLYICGVECIEIYMKRFSEIPDEANLDPIDFPLIIGPDELAEVVEAFADHKEVLIGALRQAPTDRVDYADKNVENNMTEEFAKALRRRYLSETYLIRQFLADPQNRHITAQYELACDEFELEIIAKRREFQTFDNVFQYMEKLLIGRDPILRTNKRLTRAMLFYMYWNCDIGKVPDADSVEA